MKSNFTALLAVLAAIAPLIAGTLVFHDETWWWLLCATLFAGVLGLLLWQRPRGAKPTTLAAPRAGAKEDVMPTVLGTTPTRWLEPNMPWWQFILCVAIYLVLIVWVIAALYFGYVPDLNVPNVHPLVVAAAGGLLAHEIQRMLSRSRRGRAAIDRIVSITMLVIIAVAVVVMWWQFPLVRHIVGFAAEQVGRIFGAPLLVEVNDYTVGIVAFFGFPTILDVVFRDMLGIGRRRRSLGDIDIVGDEANIDTTVNVRVWFRNLLTGERELMENVPPVLAERLNRYYRSMRPAPPPPAPAPVPPTPPTPPAPPVP